MPSINIIRWESTGFESALAAVAHDGKVILCSDRATRKRVQDVTDKQGTDVTVDRLWSWVMSRWAEADGAHSPIQHGELPAYAWEAFDAVEARDGKLERLRRNKGTMGLAGALASSAIPWVAEEGTAKWEAYGLTQGEAEMIRVAREVERMVWEDGKALPGRIYSQLPEILHTEDMGRGIVLVGFHHMSMPEASLVARLCSLVHVDMLVEGHLVPAISVTRVPLDDGSWDVSNEVVPGSEEVREEGRTREMLGFLESLGVTVTRDERDFRATDSSPVLDPKATSIEALSYALYAQDASCGTALSSLPTPSDGSISLMEIGGWSAEPPAVTRRVCDLAKRHSSVAVISPNPMKTWTEVAPRMVASLAGDETSVRMSAHVEVPLVSSRIVTTFLAFVRQELRLVSVLGSRQRTELGIGDEEDEARGSRLMSVDASMRRHKNDELGTRLFYDMSRDVLGDMGWWPPDAILDMMVEESSGTDISVVSRLRSRWLSDRRLSPSDVLATIMDPEMVGTRMAEISRLVAEGDISGAIQRIMRFLVARTKAGDCAGATDADQGESPRLVTTTGDGILANTSRALGMTTLQTLSAVARGIGRIDTASHASVDRMLSCLSNVIQHDAVTGTLRATAGASSQGDGRQVVVRFLSLSDMDGMPRGSFGAVILVSQDSVTSMVPTDDTPRNAILRKVGCFADPSVMSTYRASFAHAIGVARDVVVIERAMRLPDSSGHVAQTYPSAGLMNIGLAYADEGAGLPRSEVTELDFAENAAINGTRAQKSMTIPVSSDEAVSPGMLPSLWSAIGGRKWLATRLEDGGVMAGDEPTLTAGHVDAHSSCPRKWFAEMVLGTEGRDGGVPSYALGTMTHDVLRDVHRRMLRNAGKNAIVANGGEVPTPYVKACASDEGPMIGKGPIPEGWDWPMPGSRVGGARQVTAREARVEAMQAVRRRYAKAMTDPQGAAATPHTMTDASRLSDMTASAVRFMGYEEHMFYSHEKDSTDTVVRSRTFSPRFLELPFGEENGRPVTIGGHQFAGRIDRIDMDRDREAIIIDYKSGSPTHFDTDRIISPDNDRNMQLLVYAEAARQMIPGISVEGLAYVSTTYPFAISGRFADRIVEGTNDCGAKMASQARVSEAFTKDGEMSSGYADMGAFIDAGVEAVTRVSDSLLSGNTTRGTQNICKWCAGRGICPGVRDKDGSKDGDEGTGIDRHEEGSKA